MPELNEGNYGEMTLDKEYQLGRAWVRSIRGQTRLLNDPATTYYLEQLVWQLAATSELSDHRLEILSIDSSQFNAFAAPGGIIGLNSGLLLFAKTEGELASVIAHELAHLSQRHFASQVEEQRRYRPVLIASVLASIIAASVDSSVGNAALSTTLAANQANSLKFSRQNEYEADRIGMKNLVAAGYSASSMPKMFGRLMETHRFSSRPPEFLTTHPLTEARVADSENRANTLSRTQNKLHNSETFSLIKPRIIAHHSKDKSALLSRIEHKLSKTDLPAKETANLHYQYFISAVVAGITDRAEKAWGKLPKNRKQHWLTQLAYAEHQLNRGNYKKAILLLQKQNSLYPGNYPIIQTLAHSYHLNGQIDKALKLYKQLSIQRPNDNQIKYQLAELYGLANDTTGVHRSRIEYFLLTGNIDAALKQVAFAKHDKRVPSQHKAQFTELEQLAKDVRQQMDISF